MSIFHYIIKPVDSGAAAECGSTRARTILEPRAPPAPRRREVHAGRTRAEGLCSRVRKHSRELREADGDGTGRPFGGAQRAGH